MTQPSTCTLNSTHPSSYDQANALDIMLASNVLYFDDVITVIKEGKFFEGTEYKSLNALETLSAASH